MASVEQLAAPAAPALSMARSPSLAEQAADAIVTGVSAGALKPGQRLVETELAGLLQMSRVPLREALKILETQGIVESIPHRGTRVATFDETRITQICEARVALERLALRDAAIVYPRNPGLLERLDQIIAVMERAADRLEWIDVSKADLSFHREICRASGNTIVQTLWETLARHVFIIFGHEIRDERDAEAMGPQHRRLRSYLAAGESEKLHAEIEHHIMRLRTRK
ncbi:MAG: GntR family transcriptional regulator [Rhizobiales bacterium]|nr:GntR family transcriptional regulator [Hyphomicrobiales bacterium]